MDYDVPAETYNDYGDAVIDKNGNPTALYDIAKTLHAEVKAIGPTLINLETSSTGQGTVRESAS